MSSARTALFALVFVLVASVVLVLDVGYAATHHRAQTSIDDCALVLTTSGHVCRP